MNGVLLQVLTSHRAKAKSSLNTMLLLLMTEAVLLVNTCSLNIYQVTFAVDFGLVQIYSCRLLEHGGLFVEG